MIFKLIKMIKHLIYLKRLELKILEIRIQRLINYISFLIKSNLLLIIKINEDLINDYN